MMLSILGAIMHFNGKFDESIAVTKNAMRLCPYYPALFLRILSMSYLSAGRYKEGLAASELLLARAHKGEFSPLWAHMGLAEAYIGLSQDQKARVHAEEMLKMNPNFSLADERKRLYFYRDPSHMERHIDALRKAGLPEKPSASIPPSDEVAPKERIVVPKTEKVAKPAPSSPPKEEAASKEKMAFPLPDVPSIAVLPFVNLSEDPKQEFLSDGISEEIINALSKVRHLFVISRQSTFSYKGKPVKVKQVSEELGVQYVLEGSVQRSADRIRINAQLIDALTGRHIWAQRYDRDLTDLFALQDDITMKILTAIRVKLTEGEQVSGVEKYFRGKQGLDCYLKYLEMHNYLFGANIKGTMAARRIGEEAIEMCPENPIINVLMSGVNYLEYWLGLGKSPRESIEKGMELAQKAVAMDDSLSSAHGTLSLFYTQKKEYERAIAEGERAVDLEPGGWNSHMRYGMSLYYGGRPEEALQALQKAIRLNPVGESSPFFHLGHAYRTTGRLEEAVSEYKKALQRAPDNIFAHLGLAATYSMMGREQEARAEATEVLRISPKFSVDSYAKRLTFKDQSVADKFIDALRKAGLK
jgi:adenylate cyclase